MRMAQIWKSQSKNLEDDSPIYWLSRFSQTNLASPCKRYNKLTQLAVIELSATTDLARVDGFALQQKIYVDAQLKLKCIPNLFFSTGVDQRMVIDAYSLSVQSFFIKPATIPELEKMITVIIEYW
ncbi:MULTISPECIES: hypothetical protein [Spirosoma]|uniref:Response regulator n=1 Tax=Spirosoma liriopis TaxID=2937440 RepID=A0ABT0HTI4_9BACT|nr:MULTISPECIES: hypothetical protein [Spirosoma]MCK8495499.1 hypothetical protein [Spirosoma liriopis]UHG94512.1 hypothetical protein LQ777_28400 [Spirosoma oryzicola]